MSSAAFASPPPPFAPRRSSRGQGNNRPRWPDNAASAYEPRAPQAWQGRASAPWDVDHMVRALSAALVQPFSGVTEQVSELTKQVQGLALVVQKLEASMPTRQEVRAGDEERVAANVYEVRQRALEAKLDAQAKDIETLQQAQNGLKGAATRSRFEMDSRVMTVLGAILLAILSAALTGHIAIR